MIPRWLKSRLKSINRKLTRPYVTIDSITNDLAKLGVRPGGTLLVHSSLSAMGRVEHGAFGVIEALKNVVGSDGTLMIPTHTWAYVSKGSREFDVKNTATHLGAIPETFRRMESVVRSLHPTHSVAATGSLAKKLLDGHEQATSPCGDGTPYAKLMSSEGQILLLGVPLKRNTCFHSVEAMAGVPYLLRDRLDEFRITDSLRKTITLQVRRHASARKSRFDDLALEFLTEGCLTVGRIGAAESMLLNAKLFRDSLIAKLLDNPSYLLAKPLSQREFVSQ